MSPSPADATARDATALVGPRHDRTRSLVVAVLVGAVVLAAAIVLAVAMANQPRLEPIAVATVTAA